GHERGPAIPAQLPSAGAITKAGGCVLGSYKEPLGGHAVLLSILPIDSVEPTPFQRNLSDAHHKRLADVINKTRRFLDPVIAVPAPGGGFWTPNGQAMECRYDCCAVARATVSERSMRKVYTQPC